MGPIHSTHPDACREPPAWLARRANRRAGQAGEGEQDKLLRMDFNEDSGRSVPSMSASGRESGKPRPEPTTRSRSLHRGVLPGPVLKETGLLPRIIATGRRLAGRWEGKVTS